MYIAASDTAAPLHICRVGFLLLRKRRDLPSMANCNERRGAAGSGPGSTIKYLRQTTSGAAGCGLGTTIK